MGDSPDVKDRALKPETVARELLSCSRKHVYSLIALGELEAVKIGPRGLRVLESSVRRFLERNRVRAVGA